MKLLLIDCSYELCLGIYEGDFKEQGHIIGSFLQTRNNGHKMENIVHDLKGLLSSTQTNIKDIKCLGIITGPGYFSGIRTSLTLAKILRLALGIEAWGLNALQVIGLQYFELEDKKANFTDYIPLDKGREKEKQQALLVTYDIGKEGAVIALFNPKFQYVLTETYLPKENLLGFLAQYEHLNLIIIGNKSSIFKEATDFLPNKKNNIYYAPEIPQVTLKGMYNFIKYIKQLSKEQLMINNQVRQLIGITQVLAPLYVREPYTIKADA
ncbi:putative TsaB/YeaZ-like tRNA threonylcarbamoyl adenosine modification domain protein [Candidatus Hepatincolaceae symbiont of Richtersius coronifer]